MLDTPDSVQAMVVERWRAMSPTELLHVVDRLNASCERLSEAGVRQRHPAADDDEVRLRVIALRLGRDLMVEVYGWDPDVEGW